MEQIWGGEIRDPIFQDLGTYVRGSLSVFGLKMT